MKVKCVFAAVSMMLVTSAAFARDCSNSMKVSSEEGATMVALGQESSQAVFAAAPKAELRLTYDLLQQVYLATFVKGNLACCRYSKANGTVIEESERCSLSLGEDGAPVEVRTSVLK